MFNMAESKSCSTTEQSRKKPEEANKKLGYQILAKLSFIFILIICGLPLWWKLTEVERNYFPYAQIDVLNSTHIKFLVSIYICTLDPGTADEITRQLYMLCSESSIFSVNIQACPVDNSAKISNIKLLESNVEIHSKIPGVLYLWELPPSADIEEVTVGKHRTVYFKSQTCLNKIYKVLRDVVFLEEDIIEAIETVTSSGHTTSSISQLRRVRPNTEYDVIFTTVYSEPKKFPLKWDQRYVIERYFEPFLQQLSSLAQFNVKSHWLFSANLVIAPKEVRNEMPHFHTFTYEQIPHIITPLENRLGSGVLKNPCIHFVLYCSKCSQSPTYFVDRNGTRSIAVLSDRWGGIQLLNPTIENCNMSKPLMVNKIAIDIFIKQFRLLCGLRNFTETANILPAEETIIRGWELDILYRLRISEFFIKSKLTLVSLSQLLGEINNIVITKEVSDAVIDAVYATENILIHSKNGNLYEALNFSKQAYTASEYSFTHPSLLALLYFPDDQKYAVYIPLFLPVMIPVVLSFSSIRLWIKKCWQAGSFVSEDISNLSDEEGDDKNK